MLDPTLRIEVCKHLHDGEVHEDGVVLRHLARGVARCSAYFAWCQPMPGRPLYVLESRNPLTVTPELVCPRCGLKGQIRDGEWVAA